MNKKIQPKLFRKLQLFFQKIFSSYNHSQIVRREKILKILSKSAAKNQVPWFIAFRVSRLQVIYAFLCLENILAVASLFTLIVTTGAFVSAGYAGTFESVLMVALLAVSSFIVYPVFGFLLQPLHLKYGVPNIALILTSSTFSSSIIAIITPHLWRIVSGGQHLGLSWFNLFSGYLAVFLSVRIFVYYYHTDIFDFTRFKEIVGRKSKDFDLPSDLQGRILLLQARDHYVDITTDKGTHSLRMKFSEALDLVSELSGIQTHRSFWVAEGQIEDIKTQGTKSTATLKSGQEVPVTANRLPAVKIWASIN